jgi:AraC-like DNA-binding protein/tetratricopeptide (TPR) repeat protein
MPVKDVAGRIEAAARLIRAGQPRRALTLLEEIRPTVPGDDPALAANLHIQFSDAWFEVGEYSQSASEALAAESCAEQVGDHAIIVLAGVYKARAAYQFGNYSGCEREGEATLRRAEAFGDPMLVSRACQILVIVHGARRQFDQATHYGERALSAARRAGNGVQEGRILNTIAQTEIGIVLAKLHPHGHGHASSFDPHEAAAQQDKLNAARDLLLHAMKLTNTAEDAALFAMVEANLQRVRILLGEARETLPILRRKLRSMQEQGRRHYEISLRQFYAWALRVAGHPDESLVQIDAALGLCRKGRNATRIVEFLHYDRSLVQAALGNHAEALKSYQRYKQFAAAWSTGPGTSAAADALQPSRPGRVLEPFYVKRADRLLRESFGTKLTTDKLAELCGVSTRTLQLGFRQFRGVSPVAHARNLRLERSHQALKLGDGSVSEIAARHGFGSLTTFSIEYRRRFGETPRETLARSRQLAA